MEIIFHRFIESITPLIPVIVGAIIGIVGGLVGTGYAHKLSTNEKKTENLKTKLEGLVTEVYEINIWLRKEENHCFYGGEETLEQSPVSKIEAIQVLYFPDLAQEVDELSVAAFNYKIWLNEGAQLRLKACTNTPPQEHLNKLKDYYPSVIASKKKLIMKAKSISQDLHDS